MDPNNPYDIINNMTTVSFDLETTGLNLNKDQIWSAGYYINDQRKGEYFFRLPGQNLNSRSSSEKLTDYIVSQHSSEKFAKEQLERGALGGWVQANKNQQTSTLQTFINDLSSEFKGTGGILLGQNINFEDRFLSREAAKILGKDGHQLNFTPLTSQLSHDRGIGVRKNPRGVADSYRKFLMSSDISDERLLRIKALQDLNDPRNSSPAQNKLDAYYTAARSVWQTHLNNIAKARAEKKIAVVDLMDLSTSIYAHAVRIGQLDASYIGIGSSVEALSQALSLGPEAHEALKDSAQQKQLFKILVKEQEAIDKNSNHQSPIIDKLVDYIKQKREVETTFKDRAKSVLQEAIENKTNIITTKEDLLKELRDNFFVKNVHLHKRDITKYFDLDHFHSHLENEIHSFYSLNDKLSNDFGSKLNNHLEKVIESYIPQVPASSSEKSISSFTKPAIEFLKKPKGKIALGTAATVVLGPMLFHSKEKKENTRRYNTYDEVYNAQELGSAFADWQQRNQSYKMN